MPHIGDEPVPAAGDRRDKAVLLGSFAEGPPQGGDVLREVVLFDDRIGPHLGEQFILRNDPIVVLRKESEDVRAQIMSEAFPQGDAGDE